MSVDADAHRRAARRFASGVTVAAATWDGLSHAITATAFCSLSLEPPLVLLAVRSGSRLLELARASGSIGISVLGAHQRHVGEWAATPGREPLRRLPAHTTATAATGAPLVRDAIAWFDCRIVSLEEHGDHHVVVGRVEAAGAAPGEPDPLVYWEGGWHTLGPGSLLSGAEPEPDPGGGDASGITVEGEVG